MLEYLLLRNNTELRCWRPCLTYNNYITLRGRDLLITYVGGGVDIIHLPVFCIALAINSKNNRLLLLGNDGQVYLASQFNRREVTELGTWNGKLAMFEL